jgi:type IV secretion system protein VirB5
MNRQPDVSPTAGLETPYLRASQAWDDRIGNARVQAKNWRLCALGGLLVSLAAVGGLIYQSSKSHVVPYVVEVDTQGQVRTVGPAQVAYVPSQALVQKQVSDFVRDIRVLPSDPVVLRQQWHRAYAMVTPRGGALLTALNRDQQPESKLGKHMVTVTVERALPVSDRSYDVRWRETTFGAGGEPLGTTHRSGIFQVQTCPPTTAEALQGNPLGICIDTFAW